MQPDTPSSIHRLDPDEAVQDATALVGHLDPDSTERLDGSQHPTPARLGHDWNRISATIADFCAARVPVDDARVQEVIHDHYRWICHFWTPDRDSYVRLANLYVNQPKFRKRIERKKPAGTATYLKDAMLAYASTHLH
ncbi:hypothetical protein GIY23_17920 [Allosaccharopolyspora coralli]|uniref:TipAS antibiotic-recognition domain-containing protein n=1 Tax=Allosaccharopolyspora coralli TaxID=2665642 RepID=A0A5Q3QI05_9PSEU|nr:TipAS antibiotic-recognition domain-containing protein [Allosaccharopolyspora coralli]QGK71145.1 hypothetical protein GIY23_17920 [Allosaccharopolyspora coralli]